MNRPIQRRKRGLLALGGSGLLLAGWLLLGGAPASRAQLSGNLFSEDFATSEYYPNKSQVRLRLGGKRAEPSGPGRYLIQQLKVETFYEDGQRELTLEAPECLYDFKARTASSAGPLKIVLGEGRAIVTGEGFLWQQSAASLILSNRVGTRLRELTKWNISR